MHGKPVGASHPAPAEQTQEAASEQDNALASAEADALAMLDPGWWDEEQRTNSLRLSRSDGLPPVHQDADWEQDATCHYLRDPAGVLQTRAANRNEVTGARDVRARERTALDERAWEDEQSTSHFKRALRVESEMLPGLIDLSRLLEPDNEPPAARSRRDDLAPASARTISPPSVRTRPPPAPPAKRPRATRPPEPAAQVTASRSAASRPPTAAQGRPTAAQGRPLQSHEQRSWAPVSLAPELRSGFEAPARTSLRPGRSPWLWSLSAALPICVALGAYALWASRSPQRAKRAAVASVAVAPDVTTTTLAVSRIGEMREPPNVELHPIELALAELPDQAPVALAQAAEAQSAPIVREPHDRSRATRPAHARRVSVAVAPSPINGTDSHVRLPPGQMGVLQINSRPWSRVLIDGGFVGHTPQRAISLDVGRHTVQLINESFSMSKTIQVTIAPGQTVKRIETLDDDAAPLAH